MKIRPDWEHVVSVGVSPPFILARDAAGAQEQSDLRRDEMRNPKQRATAGPLRRRKCEGRRLPPVTFAMDGYDRYSFSFAPTAGGVSAAKIQGATP